MRRFPALCVDGFYENPDDIRDYALSLQYEKAKLGNHPGKRTQYLNKLNPKLFNMFVRKIGYLFYDFTSPVEMEIQTCFAITERYDENPTSCKNIGWIHQDNLDNINYDVAGLVYLTPDIEVTSGTSVYRLTNDKFIDYGDARIPYYKDGIDIDYDESLRKNNEQFEQVMRFGNVYNRLVIYDANLFHAADCMHTKNPRLTQLFFAKINCETMGSPIERCKYVEEVMK